MKIQYCIFILLVCFTSCKNISSKQGRTMAASVQDSLKDSRYDSIVSFDAHHMYERGLKKGKNTICTRIAFSFVKKTHSIVGNIILILILMGI